MSKDDTPTEGLSKEERKAQKAARKAEKEARRAEKAEKKDKGKGRAEEEGDVKPPTVEGTAAEARSETKEERKARKAREKAEKAGKGEGDQDKKNKKDKKEKKDKKRKREEADAPAEATETDEGQAGAEPGAVDGDSTVSGGPSAEPKKPKKAKKSKLEKAREKEKKDQDAAEAVAQAGAKGEAPSGIFGDASLSDQAKKNIYYAHLFSLSQAEEDESKKAETGWKFNKAKQNWLMRNVFSADEIPDQYHDVVLGYLKTAQGRSRSSLIEAAQKIVSPPEPETTTSIPAAADGTASAAAVGDVDMADSSAETATPGAEDNKTDAVEKADNDAESAQNASPAEAKNDAKVAKQKERAQKLLDVMKSV
ncbi:hypothetical protein IAU60_003546 [Kwoniella sp. DSM 27419]